MPEGRLVEVRHRFPLIEAHEERFLVNAVERSRRPVQDLDEAERHEPPGSESCWKSARRTGARRCQTAVRQSKLPDGGGDCRDQSTHAEKTP